ncbi:hypothetical protein Bca4012_000009 [Brassica carinata]
MDQERLTAEMAFRLSRFFIGRYTNPAALTTVLFFLIILPLTGTVLVQLTGLTFDTFSDLWSNQVVQLEGATRLACMVFLCFVLTLYVANRSKPVYLVDFSCYEPEDERKMSVDSFLKMTEGNGAITKDTVQFQERISNRAGLGDETYLPRGITSTPPKLDMSEARTEAEVVMFGALDSLFEKTGIKPAEIGILIVNCSLFNPTPSLSAMIVNHYKMREDIKSYNLGGMGCSAGLISVDLANNLLKANPNSCAVVILFLISLVKRKMFKLKVKPYIPDFKLAFEHFCIHAGGRAVLDEMQKNLDLKDWHMEPSRMTLHRFGNTSSSSLWYEMAYTEAKGRVKAGDRLWQIAFGSGFKCNSAVWKALRAVSTEEMTGNAWAGSTEDYPVKIVQ